MDLAVERTFDVGSMDLKFKVWDLRLGDFRGTVLYLYRTSFWIDFHFFTLLFFFLFGEGLAGWNTLQTGPEGR